MSKSKLLQNFVDIITNMLPRECKFEFHYWASPTASKPASMFPYEQINDPAMNS